MPRKKLPYKEGDWFGVPLEQGGFALGRVARIGSRGGVVLGFFFPDHYPQMPAANAPIQYQASDATFVCQFCDPGLLDGTWPILRTNDPWDRREWSATEFGYVDRIDRTKAYRRTYEDDNPFEFVKEEAISLSEARALPKDGLYGHIALQGVLSDRLAA